MKKQNLEYDMIPKSFEEEMRKAAKSKMPDRFYGALFRNIKEIQKAILERGAIISLESAGSKHGIDFFKISHWALCNDMIGCAIRVLEKDKKCTTATFWYLYRCDQKTMDAFAKEKKYDLNALKIFADDLKKIRDRVLFHIDKKGMLFPKKVWREANISHKDFGRALEQVLDILQHVRRVHVGKELAMPQYDGSDVTKLIIAAEREGIIPDYGRSNS